ncbi:MAG: putative transcriptional regulatory protein YxjL [Verrucomicrobiota bacterium]
MSVIRILLVDDQAMFREGLRTVLSLHEDFVIVGEAENGNEAVLAVEHLRPHVVLMDMRMPSLGGVEATRRIVRQGSACRVIVLTTFDDDEEVFEALRAGAVGYLLKDAGVDRLAEAIRATARGESFLHPSIAAKVVAEFNRLSLVRKPEIQLRGQEALSAREREVLRQLAAGKCNKEIAVALMLAEGTVKNHLSNIFGKLGVLDRTQAALRARELGLV